MKTYILAILAGLCLAIFTIGCGNNGPLVPPIDTGEVVIISDESGPLVAQELVTLVWQPVAEIDYFKVEFSTDGGKSWELAITKTTVTANKWQIPPGTDTLIFVIRVNGYSTQFSAPRSRAQSIPMKVIPYSSISSFAVNMAPGTVVNLATDIQITAKDQYDNTVMNYSMGSLEMTNIGEMDLIVVGSGTIVPNNVVIQTDEVCTFTTMLSSWSNGTTNDFGPIKFLSTGIGGIAISDHASTVGSTTIIVSQ